ncbi:hypothetical protein LINPERHAP1_LOCUS18070, partial [Linum perenne]
QTLPSSPASRPFIYYTSSQIAIHILSRRGLCDRLEEGEGRRGGGGSEAGSRRTLRIAGCTKELIHVAWRSISIRTARGSSTTW